MVPVVDLTRRHRRFEAAFADYCGTDWCVGVASGTAALHLSLLALGVGPGDVVATVPHTFTATVEAIEQAGARTRFVDVDPDYLLIDPDAVEAAITPRTRVIAPVHLYGQTAPVEHILPIADAHGIVVVEDAAQSQGASSVAGRADDEPPGDERDASPAADRLRGRAVRGRAGA